MDKPVLGTEKEEKISETQAAAPETAESNVTPSKAKEPDHASEKEGKKKRKTTIGEKIFDWSVYGGIGWVANATLSVFITLLIQNNILQGDKKYGEKVNKKAEDLYAKVGPFRETKPDGSVQLNKAGHFALDISLLTSGGHLLMVPIKFLEDNKRKIVGALNKKFGKPEDCEAIEECDKALADEPKQTWKSVLSGRFIGLVPIAILASTCEKPLTWVFRTAAAPFQALFGTDQAYGKFRKDEGFKAYIQPLTADDKKARSLKAKTIDLLVTDFTLSAIVAAVLYISSKAIASFTSKHDKKEREHSPLAKVVDEVASAKQRAEEVGADVQETKQNHAQKHSQAQDFQSRLGMEQAGAQGMGLAPGH